MKILLQVIMYVRTKGIYCIDNREEEVVIILSTLLAAHTVHTVPYKVQVSLKVRLQLLRPKVWFDDERLVPGAGMNSSPV